MKILVAEDDAASMMTLRALLEQEGHQVTGTSDGEEAWKAAQAGVYPVVILDWMMPRMDGLEVCRNIRSAPVGRGGYVCIIMLTAKEGRENRMQALGAGADVFLSKPLDREVLIARLQVAQRIIAMEERTVTAA